MIVKKKRKIVCVCVCVYNKVSVFKERKRKKGVHPWQWVDFFLYFFSVFNNSFLQFLFSLVYYVKISSLLFLKQNVYEHTV